MTGFVDLVAMRGISGFISIAGELTEFVLRRMWLMSHPNDSWLLEVPAVVGCMRVGIANQPNYGESNTAHTKEGRKERARLD